MGIEITDSHFSAASYGAFEGKLQQNLAALAQLLEQPEFGRREAGCAAIGAELEMYIIDSQGQPLCINQQVLDAAGDPQLTLELNRYNLEYNLTPYALADQPFSATEREILTQLKRLNQLAQPLGGRVIPIGILPTLETGHFGPACLTDRERYRALVDQLIERRGGDFHIHINGEHPLQLAMRDVTLEGANTSFQVHYRIDPEVYAESFNAFQLVTPLVLAVAGNSPGLFGHNLWHETRIPLFKQSIDCRARDRYQWHEPARVNFGQGWVRQSVLELFREVVNIYPPLLPICSEDQPLDQLRAGITPSLAELRLQQGSVWLWNRPVYDDTGSGHLRIELRALPAGPTAIDMVANAVFYIGLAEFYRAKMQLLMPALPFGLAEYNFYRAAQAGLEAKIAWPCADQSGCALQPILNILRGSVEKARAGLLSIGLAQAEVDYYLAVIQNRIDRRQTGSLWQSQRIAHYCKKHSREESQYLMLEDYIRHSVSNEPVSDWPLRE